MGCCELAPGGAGAPALPPSPLPGPHAVAWRRLPKGLISARTPYNASAGDALHAFELALALDKLNFR